MLQRVLLGTIVYMGVLRQHSSLAHGRMLAKVRDTGSRLLPVLHAEVAGRLAELRVRPHAVLRPVIIDHLIKLLILRWHLLEGNHLRWIVPLLLLLLGSLLLHQPR